MPSLDELRHRWATGPSKPEAGEKPYPEGAKSLVAPVAIGPDDAIVWSEPEVRAWSKRGDVVTAGHVISDKGTSGYAVKDFRFKSGRYTGKTVRELAANNGRLYLRWWYTQLPKSETTEGMTEFIRRVLGETDAVIREKDAAEEI